MLSYHAFSEFQRLLCPKGTWCSWLSRSLSISPLARGVRFNPGRVHFSALFCMSNTPTPHQSLRMGSVFLHALLWEDMRRIDRAACRTGNGPEAASINRVVRRPSRCLPAARTTISKRDCTGPRGTGPVIHVGRGKASNSVFPGSLNPG